MLVGRLSILAVALATAAAWPRPGEDALDDWFNPFFTCKLMSSQEIQEKQTELHAQLHEAKRKSWPTLKPEEKTILIETANKIKPVIVEMITSSCTLVSSLNETEMRLLKKVSNILRDRVLETKFRSDLRKKLTIGDLSSIDTLSEKLIQELRVVLHEPTVELTESERNNYINYFTQAIDIVRNAINGLTPIIKALTIQEFVDLKLAIQKLIPIHMR